MLVPRGKIEECVLDDPTRPSLQSVWLRGDYLEATDTFKLVRVPVSGRDTNDMDGPIPPLAIKLAREINNGTLVAKENTCVMPGKAGINRPATIKEPPSFASYTKENPIKADFVVGLNAKYLRQIAAAFGTEDVVLELTMGNPYAAILVRPSGTNADDGRVALLMPVKVRGAGATEPDEPGDEERPPGEPSDAEPEPAPEEPSEQQPEPEGLPEQEPQEGQKEPTV